MRGRTLSRVLWVRGLLRVVPFWTLNPNAKNFMLLPPSSAFADEWMQQQQVGWVEWMHATGDYLIPSYLILRRLSRDSAQCRKTGLLILDGEEQEEERFGHATVDDRQAFFSLSQGLEGLLSSCFDIQVSSTCSALETLSV